MRESWPHNLNGAAMSPAGYAERTLSTAWGKSTGPRTASGLERGRRTNWKHGYYSAQEKAQRAAARASRHKLQELIAELRARGLRLG